MECNRSSLQAELANKSRSELIEIIEQSFMECDEKQAIIDDMEANRRPSVLAI